MSDCIHETAATPSVSLAVVVRGTLLCVCVFSRTMYLDRQRYTVFWPYTVCRPHTKTNIIRTHAQTFLFAMHQLETRFARIKTATKVRRYVVIAQVDLVQQNHHDPPKPYRTAVDRVDASTTCSVRSTAALCSTCYNRCCLLLLYQKKNIEAVHEYETSEGISCVLLHSQTCISLVMTNLSGIRP